MSHPSTITPTALVHFRTHPAHGQVVIGIETLAGFMYRSVTPGQALALADSLIRDARECVPPFFGVDQDPYGPDAA